MATITVEQETKILDFVSTHHISSGLGTEEEACSIAAINLVLRGELTDSIPECMSEVIGKWIIRIQDTMPDSMRNSLEWKRLLPLAAGTGRDAALEKKRLEIVLDWMWAIVLPPMQSIADINNFGKEWKTMLEIRSPGAARAAAEAAEAAEAAAWAARAAWAAEAARAAAWAAEAAARAAEAARAEEAARAAEAAAWAARAAVDEYWTQINPVEVLRKLVEVKERNNVGE